MQETQQMWVWSLGGEARLKDENGNPLQYSCLGNPMDRGAWQATVHGVEKSRTQLSNWSHTHTQTHTHTHRGWAAWEQHLAYLRPKWGNGQNNPYMNQSSKPLVSWSPCSHQLPRSPSPTGHSGSPTAGPCLSLRTRRETTQVMPALLKQLSTGIPALPLPQKPRDLMGHLSWAPHCHLVTLTTSGPHLSSFFAEMLLCLLCILISQLKFCPKGWTHVCA